MPTFPDLPDFPPIFGDLSPTQCEKYFHSQREIFPFPTRNISPKTTNLECPFMGEESKGVSRVAAKNVLHTVPGGLFFTTNDDTSKVMIYHLTRKRLLERARNCKRIPNWTRCSITKRLLKRDIRRSSPIYYRQRQCSL